MLCFKIKTYEQNKLDNTFGNLTCRGTTILEQAVQTVDRLEMIVVAALLQVSVDGNVTVSTLKVTPSLDDAGETLSCRATTPPEERKLLQDSWMMNIYRTSIQFTLFLSFVAFVFQALLYLSETPCLS